MKKKKKMGGDDDDDNNNNNNNITFLKYLCGHNRSGLCFFNKTFFNKQRVVFAIVLFLLLRNLYVLPWNL